MQYPDLKSAYTTSQYKYREDHSRRHGERRTSCSSLAYKDRVYTRAEVLTRKELRWLSFCDTIHVLVYAQISFS
jgi:hypothetical protein